MPADTAGDEGVVTGLLQEHDELVQLMMHDDIIAWYLNLALLATNGGLLSAVETQGVFEFTEPVDPALWLVLFAGLLLNVVGHFALQRRKVHRLSRLYRALRIEAELDGVGCPVRTFSSAEALIAQGRMLVPPISAPPPPAPHPTRRLTFQERLTFLDLRFLFYVMAIVYLAIVAWVVMGRPTV